MASVTGITAAKATEILGQSVISGIVNAQGRLILTRSNGQTFDGGDFKTIMTGLVTELVAPAVETEVFNKVSGKSFARGQISGPISFSGITAPDLVNGMFTGTLVGPATLSVESLPAGVRPGTQFSFRLTQDSVGGRTITLSGFKKSQGVLTLSTAPNAIDILVFMYDGTNWYAGLMGVDFK